MDTNGIPQEDQVAIRSVDSMNASKPVTVSMEQAVQQAKDAMGSGKWLEIVYPDDSSEVIMDGNEFFEDMDTVVAKFARADEVTLVVALTGGQE